MIGIYKITNTINNKMYIGLSINIQERIAEHKRLALNKEFINKFLYPLYLALNKYGLENFKFEIITECDPEQLNSLELYWIKTLNTYINSPNSQGYNLTYGGDGHRIISDKLILEIIALWDEGLSTGDISLITELDKHTILRYLKKHYSYTIDESNRRGHINSSLNHQKAINVYNKYAKLISTFSSIKEAGEKLNIDSSKISAAASNKIPSLYGMFFLNISDNQLEGLIDRMSRQKPPAIIETNKDNTLILNIFFTKDEIKTYLKREAITGVQPCCKGRCKTAYGHYWMYLYKYIEKFGIDNLPINIEEGYVEEKFK